MRSFLIALQFLTRIQVASRLTWSDVDFGRAVVWFPVVGLLIGLLTALARGLTGILFSPFLSAVLTVACWYFLTGGLHS
ncbi:MAG: adenosylcobinamide-GDP ribazoletransferase, partial [Megasphaera micronuciformis]|nr:adenosylcobinamide-GDP ribazoletransferase [Megasphaera micronuciformis]